MEKWIILIMIDEPEMHEIELSHIAVCDYATEKLMVFDSLEEAVEYQDNEEISGRCVEIPLNY